MQHARRSCFTNFCQTAPLSTACDAGIHGSQDEGYDATVQISRIGVSIPLSNFGFRAMTGIRFGMSSSTSQTHKLEGLDSPLSQPSCQAEPVVGLAVARPVVRSRPAHAMTRTSIFG